MASAKPAIPEFKADTIENINATVATLRSTFNSGRTKDVQYRLVQLRKLYWGVKDNVELLQAALFKDMRKSPYESLISEMNIVTDDCLYMIENLERFVKDEPFEDIPLHFRLVNLHCRKEPLGAALVISAYNFPVVLSLQPFIGVIAAGCTGILKPSESAPATAMVLKKIFDEYLDPEAYVVVNGTIPETTALLDARWDKICFTGGANVGKIVARKAAEHLTPTLLELGGLNPAIVARNADLKLAARRLLWGKCLNAGQVCMSQNYTLVDRAILSQYIEAMKAAHDQAFPNGPKASPDLARVINRAQFMRMKRMLDETRGKIILGGEMDEAELYIAPTVVLVDSADDITVREESFGPIQALMAYDNLDEAIALVNSIDRTPLVLATFGNSAENKKVLENTTSGAANVNETFMSGSIHNLKFGGVGGSGMGCYRGRESFEAFTYRRPVASTPSWLEGLLRVRYMPYDMSELQFNAKLTEKKPNFDRNGRQVNGLRQWVSLILGLGAKSSKAGMLRWVVVLFLFYTTAVRKDAWKLAWPWSS